MIKAGKTVEVYINVLYVFQHLTCLAHVLHQIVKTINEKFQK